MKNRIAGMITAVMAAAMVMTVPMQAYAGGPGVSNTMGYVTPCTNQTTNYGAGTQRPAAPVITDVYVTASSPAAYSPAPAQPARQGQYEAVRMEINGTEEQTAALDRRMQTAQTQLEMNQLAAQKYQIWDNELNSVWKRLEGTLSADAMNRLRNEERTWITQKEASMKQAAAAYGSGSMADMAYVEKGTELTRARVYILAEYLR
ncbi:MAG: DUF1311 domain-containing protein [Stomatobaculum sp.]|nr:DUF1311 domain-containing protein [Stomatobaculum sp.]